MSTGCLQVLVVEDNPDNLRLMEWILEDRGCGFATVGDGEAALEHLSSGQALPDLVLMDISLPGIDGKETTRRIRAELGLTELPIIAVTAHAIMRERDAILTCGVDALLTKPVDEDALLELLDRFDPASVEGSRDLKPES